MRGEIDTYSRELRWILDQIGAALRGLTPAQLNWRPPTGAANSAYAIVSHVLGSTGVYVLGFGCNLPVRRDRGAEFGASGDDAEALVARVGRLSAEIEAALAALAPVALDERITPPKEHARPRGPARVSATRVC
jgi:hypothetical protein